MIFCQKLRFFKVEFFGKGPCLACGIIQLHVPRFTLAGFIISRKHCLATFVHERLKYTPLKQFSHKSETEWLCVDVDGYRTVKVYKPSPTRLQAINLPVLLHPFLYAGDINCSHADWGYGDNSADGECLAGWASIDSLAPLYNPKDSASFHSGRRNSRTNSLCVCYC